MEKPSLEIGNGNWAIKENSLLGHTTVDGMILPDPVTVTRASLATRVNPSGLIENVELPGSNIWDGANGDTTGWTPFGNNTFAPEDGALKITYVDNTAGVYIYLRDSNQLSTDLTIGKTYKINFDSKVESGQVEWKVQVSGGNAYLAPKINSTNYVNVTLYIVASNANGHYFFPLQYDSAASVFIKNIKVQEVTIDGLAKIDYTDGTASLLAEPQRTNLVQYSEDFTTRINLWQTFGNATKTLNAATSPDGSNTAALIAGLNGAGDNDFRYAFPYNTANKTLTYSVYLKGSGTLRLQISNGVDQAHNEDITLTSEWKRHNITGTFNSTAVSLVYLVIDDLLGKTATEYYVWGAQFEEGAYPTSYIKTQGGTITRAQDVITKTGISDKINSEEGVLLVETAFLNDTGNYTSVTLSDGTTANRITFENRPVANQIKVFIVVSGTNVMQSTQTLTDVKAFNKMAIKWKQNDFAWWVNGVKIHTDTSGNTFSANTLNRLGFDRGDGFTQLESKVKQLQVYKTALTDLELESLTSFASFTEMANTLNYTIY